MEQENWHKEFNPSKFLGRVQLAKLIERNAVYNESHVENISSKCILCENKKSLGIILNDKSFLCEDCYSHVALISYPEKYEKLHRQLLIEAAAHSLAWESFREKYEYVYNESAIEIWGWLSLLLLYEDIRFITLSIALIVIGRIKNHTAKKKLSKWMRKKWEWERENKPPQSPQLKHFHDPTAELSQRDTQILRVFDHWPGYPPYWKYLRAIVFERDANRCQVSGCPSRLELHVHHMLPVSEGGAHSPNNLVCLCQFHHALEPERGHERIWSEIKTNYFTLVRSHERSNRAQYGKHYVKAHLRRLQLITLKELSEISSIYGFECPKCGNDKIDYLIFEDKNVIRVECRSCFQMSEGPQQLTEETGPRLAEMLQVARNKGRWKARWDMLQERSSLTWGTWSSSAASIKRRKHLEAVKQKSKLLACPICGSPMKVVRPRSTDKWSSFWGCTKYPVTGCRGSKKYRSDKH